jgi:hypothetical protein
MGGPSQSSLNTSLNTQNQLTQSQINTQSAATQESQQEFAQQQQLEAPSIAFNNALTSGDPKAVLTALAPEISGVTQAKNSTAAQIDEQLPPGAARDVAQANNIQGSANQIAGTEAAAEQGAYGTLASLGQELGSNSLQALAGSISAGSAASSANQVNISAAEQSKASTLGFVGSLAGTGASFFNPVDI